MSQEHSPDKPHERRVVGHASGWQEQMDTCVCGKPWPCPSAVSHAPRIDGWCPACKGSGTMKGMTQGHGPDDYEIDIECSTCGGTGAGTIPSTTPQKTEDADMWRMHARSFDEFLRELYAIMIDPCAEGSIKRDDVMQALKDAALRDREHASTPSAMGVIDWTNFDAAYKKACETSLPQDWMDAALYAQQAKRAAETKPFSRRLLQVGFTNGTADVIWDRDRDPEHLLAGAILYVYEEQIKGLRTADGTAKACSCGATAGQYHAAGCGYEGVFNG